MRKMVMFIRTYIYPAFIALACSSEVNARTCQTADLAGVWYGTSSIVNSTNSAMNYALSCRLQFKKRGTVTALEDGKCKAVSSNPAIDGTVNVIISSEVMFLPKSCELEVTVGWDRGGESTIKGYLSLRSKEIIATTKNTTGGVGVMNFVKE
jgi:hypothetical protein